MFKPIHIFQRTTHFQDILIKKFVLQELIAKYKRTRKERAIKRFVNWFNDTNAIRRDSRLYGYYWDTFKIPPFDFREFSGAIIVSENTNGPLRDLEGIEVIIDDKDNPRYAVTFIDTKNDPWIINQYQPTHIECTKYGVTIFAIDIDWVLKQDTIPTKIEYLSVLEPISRKQMEINGWDN